METELYPATYWLVGFFGVVMVSGVLTNGAVAFASYQDKGLRNACNILIALASIADCLHLTGHITLIYAFATGNLLTNSVTCVWIEFLPIIGQNSGCALIVSIAVDRLLACFAPLWYERRHTCVYMCIQLAVVSLYVTYHFYNL
ncbi:hypothetical protein PMAYCL1PPCAC_05935 [Pristionchus mayeri]|uniref:G-protein coupled receptors family 1 profile domain-containing protein n=1 Tax=Pristionchus mayeri TaxID=1317129 RepID=A0AAN4ZAZ1_9BILA|nr:hypothetical protein PMAYCL1PPCAC_05935 [Pristionchus mayeri]